VSLTFFRLREANLKRIPLFKNSKGEVVHKKPDGSDWSKERWFQALMGEVGEYANLHKKYLRGDVGPATFLKEAAEELADTQLYFDIFAFQCGVDIDSEIGLKSMSQLRSFNAGVFGNLIHAIDSEAIFKQLVIASGEMVKQYEPEFFARFQIFLDRVALRIEIDLEEATCEKFNKISKNIGCDVFL